jgi:hypothetical protein
MNDTTNSPEAQFVIIDGKQRRVIECPDKRPGCEVLHLEDEPEAQPPNIKCDRVTCELTRSHLVGEIGCSEEWWYEQQQQAQPQGGELLLMSEIWRDLLTTWVAMQLDYHKTSDRMRTAGKSADACTNEARAEMLSWCSKELLAVVKRLPVLPRTTSVDDAAIRQALRPIRGCATDDQYIDVWERVTGLLATPRATGDTTVEAALAELREIFPHTFVRVNDTAEYSQATGLAFHVCGVAVGMEAVFHGETLADCMAQVRAATRTEGEGEKS